MPAVLSPATIILLLSAAITSIITITPAFAASSEEGISKFYAEEVNEGQVAFMWLGEGRGEWAGVASAGVMVRTSQHTVIIDPANILSSGDIDAIETLDLILITHEHNDHFDPGTTAAIHEKTGAPVAVSAGVYPFLQDSVAADSLVEMLANDLKTVNGITVRAIPAAHPSERPVMYLIELGGITVFHGSDSGFVDDLNDIDSEVHLAFVPAGMPSPTASPEDAASMVRALRPYVTVPVHGIFEQMTALKEIAGEETMVTIPGAFIVNVPSQIVPEFPVAFLVFIAALVMTFAAMIRVRPLPLCRDD